MAKKIKYELEYNENGKMKIKELKIFFICQKVIRDYSELKKEINIFKLNYEKLTSTMENRGMLLVSKPDGYAQKILDLQNEDKKLRKEMEKYNDNDFFNNRFNIIKLLLNGNGIEDEELLTFQFWDEKVSPDIITDFLETVVYKDIDLKKKALGE